MSLAPAFGAAGAPGVFIAPPEPIRSLTGVRRDIAAFVGVAPRGPAFEPTRRLEPDEGVGVFLTTAHRYRSIPIRVTSWDEYRRRFGGFEGPGRLPYAVAAFFDGGGVEAEVVRIVHDHGDDATNVAGRSSGAFAGVLSSGGDDIELTARSEGRWGDGLTATLRFVTRPLAASWVAPNQLVVDVGDWVPGGSLLRIGLSADARVLRTVDLSIEESEPAGPGRRRVLTLVAPLPAAPTSIEIALGELEVIDRDPSVPRREVMAELGLRADHPRWLARVAVDESALVWPTVGWADDAILVTDPDLPPVGLRGDGDVDHMTGGDDRWSDIVPHDFWDPQWVPGDEQVGSGVHCLAEHDDLGLLLAPDLYDPAPLDPVDDVRDPPTLCGPEFEEHVPTPPPPPAAPFEPGLVGLRLDPQIPAEREHIVAAQLELVRFGQLRREFTVLLDVPLGLSDRQAMTWRTNFDSEFAAGYHPWLDVAQTADGRSSLVRVNPSAFAAAIIAERELRLGVQHGPANELARGAVRVSEPVDPARHDELHPSGINVFAAQRDGIELTGARTLSRRPPLRQLNVARLMTVLRLTLQREMAWAVFEPSNDELWAELRRLIHGLLTRFYDAGAFRGATTKEAFFVRCDRTTMTRHDLDNGRVVCLVGVAPAEPMEYLVVQIALTDDVGVSAEVG